MRNHIVILLLAGLSWLLGGCAQHYVTPGGGVEMAALSEITDVDLQSYYESRPAAVFPSNIAIIRVQDTGYNEIGRYGRQRGGRFHVVTARDVETDESFEKIQSLAQIRGVAPVGRMLVPANPGSLRDLRLPAAQLQADMLLVYSFDTAFSVDGKQYGPLSTISFGLLRNNEAHVTVTVSGVMLDVRTGFVYGTLEASHTEHKKTSIWAERQVIETARRQAERVAFDEFVDEFAEFWPVVAATHGATNGNTPSVNLTPPGPRYPTTQN